MFHIYLYTFTFTFSDLLLFAFFSFLHTFVLITLEDISTLYLFTFCYTCIVLRRSVRASYESQHFTLCTCDLGPLCVICTRIPLFPQSTYVTVTEGKLQYLSMPLTLLMYLDHT